MSLRIDIVVRMFLFKIKTPIDPRDEETNKALEDLISSLFDASCEEASFIMDQKGFTPGIEALRCYVLYASQAWSEGAERVNEAKLPLIAPTSGGNTLTVDTRGFIGVLLQLPDEEQGPLKPILQEYLEEEAREHPEYIKFESANKQPEIRLTKREFEDIVPVNRLMERQLLPAYFDTYDKLMIYRGMHDYDDPMAKELAVRMELITKRMEEIAKGEI